LTLEEITAAVDRAAPYVVRTPLLNLGQGCHVKLECLQPTGSFKVRGFFAAALALTPERLARGLLTVSAGNAAQAAAYVAHTLGVPCRVFMFDTAPDVKVDGVRRWGATPVLVSRKELLEWMHDSGWQHEPESFIHPFRDPACQAGHGGVGLELVEQLDHVDRVLVPVGGGGLILGIAGAVKALRPSIEIVGVQSEGYPLWPRAFAAGGPVQVTPQTIADGTTAPFDEAMFTRLAEAVDRWVLVSEVDLGAAVRDLAASAKVVAEGAGALAYAAARREPQDSVSVAVVSGGNIDPQLLSKVLVEG
jgi:threonine dehydratase